MQKLSDLTDSLGETTNGIIIKERAIEANCLAVDVVDSSQLKLFMNELFQNKTFLFNMLLFHTAIDRKEENVFELVYQLYSIDNELKLMVTTKIPRNQPVVSTMSDIWPIAEFQEREAFDLFGILYENHPDLRRIFLEDDWNGYPLRKDYKDPFVLELPNHD